MNFLSINSPVIKFLNKVADLLFLNVIFVISCLPLFTIGAASTALYTVTLKLIRGDSPYILRTFNKAFKNNFKQATILWLLTCVLSTFFLLDYRFIMLLSIGQRSVLLLLFIFFIFIYDMLGNYIFPVQARFESPIKYNLKNAFIISISSGPYTLLLIFLQIVEFAIIYILQTEELLLLLPIGLLFYFSIRAYLRSLIINRVFKKYECVTDLK